MKKITIISLLTIFAVSSFASTTMGHWRWRKDNGSETTAVWAAGQDVAPTITNSSENLRLRIELYNEETDPVDLGFIYLEYTGDGGVTWDSITTYAGEKAFVLAGSSPYVMDGQSTTKQLNGVVGYPFQPGNVIVSSDFLPSNVIEPGNSTEYEWVIKPTASIKTNTTYIFDVAEQYYTDGIEPPSLITAATLPILLANFTVQPDHNRIKLQWTTSSEQNNDHFAVERSADGKSNWQVITTVKGNGTTTQTHIYAAYDHAPLNGKNFFRIKQYDADGHSQESEIRMLTMLLNKDPLMVFPNPSKGDINFALGNYKGAVNISLVDVNGKIVHKETIEADNFSVNYKLHLQKKLAPGMYFLQVNGNDLNLGRNVIVQ